MDSFTLLLLPLGCWTIWVAKEMETGADKTLQDSLKAGFLWQSPTWTSHVDSQLFNNVVEPTVPFFPLAGVLITVSSI